MGTIDKLIERFKSLPTDFTFSELERLLRYFGYEKYEKGKTSGSRIIFKNTEGSPIMIHKPHPGNIVKGYALKQILEELKQKGLI
ncbi:MAG: type II toxin-antitoxin system HicA family toxin [bacterium]|nr:type II toxin-antitoxin system HicA family toxin [Candidatus Limimorpha equi]